MQFGASSRDDEKIAVRRTLRTRLRALDPANRREAAARLVGHLIERHPGSPGLIIAGFFALPTEPDLTAYFLHAWSVGAHIAIPRLTGPGTMEFHQIPAGTLPPDPDQPNSPSPPSALRPGPYNLWEPDPSQCPSVPPAAIGLALVPGLAFAPGGARLGRGAGYYDRWLATLPAATPCLGVAFPCQILVSLPTTHHDRPVNVIATENGWVPGAQSAAGPEYEPI
ncbi:MAG: 5-formyltetrahydrofolate cyclo-ligase [Verrucomicrobiales bacterium]